MSSKGWFNLESQTSLGAASNLIPDNQFFEGDSAFAFLKLSRTTRLYGFIGCTVGGFILSVLGVIFLILGSLISFALMYALGTVLSLVGTGFLLGFQTQLKKMFQGTRIIATAVLLISIAMIFVGAFVIGSGVLCIILVIVQFLAFTWYSLSYIPYARAAIKNIVPSFF